MQTNEFLAAFFATFGQGVESFSDGAQPSDAGDFVDEAFTWPNAINGLAGAWKKEALAQSPESLNDLFDHQINELVNRGMYPMEAYAIVNGLKTAYSGYCAVVQRIERKSEDSGHPVSSV